MLFQEERFVEVVTAQICVLEKLVLTQSVRDVMEMISFKKKERN